MPYTHALLLLALVGWFMSGGTSLLAQDMPLPPRTPLPEEGPLNPGEPPTPQLLRFEVDIGASGLGPIRVPLYPPWVELRRPQLRVGQVRPESLPETDTAPRLEGGADQLHQALEQALNRATPSAEPAR